MGLFSTTQVHQEGDNYNTTNIHVDHTMSPNAIKQSNKIREAVIENMLDEVHLQDNIINGLAVSVQHTPAFDKRVEVFIRFKLNGRIFNVKEEIPKETWENLSSKEELVKRLYEWVYKHIAVEISKELSANLNQIKI